ncbi:MAG: phosphopyruvate hydratase [Candidatus Woesearchaeota archaeon]
MAHDCTIKKIFAREVLDSRGNPTIEVDVHAGNFTAREMVPSGASTGKHEALELRDGGKRFHGQGTQKAVSNVNKIIAKKIVGMSCEDQEKIDQAMIKLDGTKNKSKLGANAILGVSLAVARAGALTSGKKFHEHLAHLAGNKKYVVPVPFMNIINGGKHADNKLHIQEFMIVPHADCYKDSLQMGSEVYHELKILLKKKYGPFSTNIGDEGGFTPPIKRVREALDLLTEAVKRVGYEKKIKFAIDAAATSFYYPNRGYCLEEECYFDAKTLTSAYEDLVRDYPIVSIEDPFHEEAFSDFAALTKKVGNKMKIVGDDLTVTNIERIKRALKEKSCNCLLLKVNQIGTLTEAINAANLVLKNGWKVMVSHRSGETEDHFIADFAVGLGCGAMKAGAPCRGERTSKYNQLLRIEEKLGRCFPIDVFR